MSLALDGPEATEPRGCHLCGWRLVVFYGDDG
jgi:hypothetical protein